MGMTFTLTGGGNKTDLKTAPLLKPRLHSRVPPGFLESPVILRAQDETELL